MKKPKKSIAFLTAVIMTLTSIPNLAQSNPTTLPAEAETTFENNDKGVYRKKPKRS